MGCYTLTSCYDFKPGVFILGTNGTYDSRISVPYSCPDLTNMFNQSNASSALTSSNRQDNSASIGGAYKNLNANDTASGAIIYPNWGCVMYQIQNYTGTVLLNYKNSTKNPVCVQLSTGNIATSIKIYYLDQFIEKL